MNEWDSDEWFTDEEKKRRADYRKEGTCPLCKTFGGLTKVTSELVSIETGYRKMTRWYCRRCGFNS